MIIKCKLDNIYVVQSVKGVLVHFVLKPIFFHKLIGFL